MSAPVLKVVKIGGNVVDSPEALREFASLFVRLDGPKILVHGGGKEATRLSAALGIETRMIDGRRVTDAATIDVVTMVYAGLINKRVVVLLQSLGVNAMGVCGADASLIKAVRRPAAPVDYGFVGDISTEGVNTGYIAKMISDGITPVFCAITHDGAGQLLNCNADSVASAVAVAMSQKMDTELYYCFEKIGVLSDPDDPNSLITEIDTESFAEYKEKGIVSGGMIPKIANSITAVNQGVRKVHIKLAKNLLNFVGTEIKL